MQIPLNVIVHPPTLILPHQGGGDIVFTLDLPSPLEGEGQGEGVLNDYVKLNSENVTITQKDIIPLKEGPYIKITIEDKGIGIPETHIPKIFDPYFTTKQVGTQKGMGLGLAICYSIIKKHDGFISVESTVDKGTTFYVYIPASDKEIITVDETEIIPRPGKGKILFMDDEKVVREVTGAMLIHIGYEVLFAKDGAEAIEIYQRVKESGTSIEAVILDLTIPGGMGGKDAIKKLMDIDSNIKAIVTNGYSNDPVLAEFEKHGFAGFITKPFKLDELSEILHRVITGTD